MTTANSQTSLLKTMSMGLTVNDLQKSIEFYEGLGFAVTDRWEDKGTLMGVMMRAGSAELGLMQDDWKKGRDRQKGIGVRVHLTTDDVDQVAARAKASGITLDSEPHDMEWGRALELTDPTGFKITVMKEKK